MWLQLGAKYVQGHLKVIWAFITGVVSNYVHVITIEGQASSRSPGQLLLNWPHMRDPPGYIALIRWFNAHKIVTIKTNNTSGSRTALFTNDLNPVIAKLGETCCSRTALFNLSQAKTGTAFYCFRSNLTNKGIHNTNSSINTVTSRVMIRYSDWT